MPKSYFPKPTTTRIALLLVALWLIACALFGVLRDREVVAKRYQNNAASAASYAGIQLDRFNAEIDKLRIYPLMLANQSDVKYVLRQYSEENKSPKLKDHPETLAAPAMVRLRDTLESLARQLRVSSIFVVTPDGYILSTSRDGGVDIDDATSFSFREYFEEAIAGGPGEQFAVSTATGAPGFFFSYPVRLDDEDTIVGVVVVKVDGDTFVDNFTYEPGITFISDSNGVVMLSTAKDFFLNVLNKNEINALSVQSREEYYAQQQFIPLPITVVDRVDETAERVDVISDAGSSRYVLASELISETGWRVNVLYQVTGLTQAREYSALFMFCIFVAGTFVIMLAERTLHYLRDLRDQSRRDPLTRLYNRYHMDETVAALCALHDRGNIKSLSVLMLDIDHFKAINDTYGHPVGDKALRRIAHILTREARRGDIIYRIGGEEFLIFMVGQAPQDVIKAATRIRKRIEMIQNLKPVPAHKLTVSGGLAMHRQDESLAQLLERADALLYQAKNRGRNRVETEDLGEIA